MQSSRLIRHPRGALDPALLGRQRVPSIETPILYKSDARGRPRLRDPVPPRARHVLRAAAEPAALQAAADVRRLRPLLPDRALLAGRGAARRPRARVHAARPRDELRRAGRHLAIGRWLWPRSGALLGIEVALPLPPHDVRRDAMRATARQARPALRPRDRRSSPLGSRPRSFAVFRRGSGGRRRALPERAGRRRGALAQGLRRARRVRQGVGRQGAPTDLQSADGAVRSPIPRVTERGRSGAQRSGGAVRCRRRLGRVHRRRLRSPSSSACSARCGRSSRAASS